MSNLPEDPRGEFPRAEHFGRSNINQAALGEKRNDLKFFAQSDVVELPLNPTVNSQYGLNQIQHSITGHSFEIDDTPGNQRILIKHNTGAGIELTNDGSIYISTKESKLEVVGGTHDLIVEGNAKLVFNQNLDIDVNGEFNINCQEFNLNVEENKTETIGGAVSRSVGDGITETVVGSVSEYVTENKVTTVLGNEKHFIKSGYDMAVEASINMNSKDDLFLTAADTMNIAADNTTISANNMTVQGGAGTIGGTAMLFSGKGAVFEEGVTAPTFHGDLDGTADTAETANSQSYADPVGGGGVGSAGSITNTATPTITKPTASTVSTYLTKAAGGIKQIIIDKGNHLRDYLDPRYQSGDK